MAAARLPSSTACGDASRAAAFDGSATAQLFDAHTTTHIDAEKDQVQLFAADAPPYCHNEKPWPSCTCSGQAWSTRIRRSSASEEDAEGNEPALRPEAAALLATALFLLALLAQLAITFGPSEGLDTGTRVLELSRWIETATQQHWDQGAMAEVTVTVLKLVRVRFGLFRYCVLDPVPPVGHKIIECANVDIWNFWNANVIGRLDAHNVASVYDQSVYDDEFRQRYADLVPVYLTYLVIIAVGLVVSLWYGLLGGRWAPSRDVNIALLFWMAFAPGILLYVKAIYDARFIMAVDDAYEGLNEVPGSVFTAPSTFSGKLTYFVYVCHGAGMVMFYVARDLFEKRSVPWWTV